MVEVKSKELKEIGMEDSRDSFVISFNDETKKEEFIQKIEEYNSKGATISLTYRTDAFKNRFIEVKVQDENYPDMIMGVLKEVTKHLEDAKKLLEDYQKKAQQNQVVATSAWKNLVETYCVPSVDDQTKWCFAWNETELRSKQ